MKKEMKRVALLAMLFGYLTVYTQQATNPIIFSDVPDISIIRSGETFYMSSTTMHLSPGVPIMKSNDLVNWELVSYASKSLGDMDELNLTKGKSNYGRGSWASSLRYHKGRYYVSTFASTTNKTYIYYTDNIEKNEWSEISFSPAYHDHTLHFEDDGRAYLIYGAGKMNIVALKADLSGTIVGSERVLIENASAPTEPNMLKAEGSQLFKHDGMYYLFNISWPQGAMRTVLVHRATNLAGPWEGRIALQDKGVAQGGVIDMPDGRWFAYLFQDHGALGRIPFLVPMQWVDGWPVMGVNGKVPEKLDLATNKSLLPGLVNNDEFTRKKGEAALPLVWQWNHNPDNKLWSVSERPGYLRLKTGRIDSLFLQSRNTLTQRTFGPVCAGITKLDVSNLRDGDYAGLAALQRKFGLVGVKVIGKQKYLYMVSNKTDTPTELQHIPFSKNTVFLKIECDFRNKIDVANFFYSLDGKKWHEIGSSLKMEYTLIEHFMGYRFGLYNYSSKNPGGYADFDYFRFSDKLH